MKNKRFLGLPLAVSMMIMLVAGCTVTSVNAQSVGTGNELVHVSLINGPRTLIDDSELDLKVESSIDVEDVDIHFSITKSIESMDSDDVKIEYFNGDSWVEASYQIVNDHIEGILPLHMDLENGAEKVIPLSIKYHVDGEYQLDFDVI